MALGVSLSVCLITADPAARIAAILEPLRPFADEVVIAADARVDESTLAGYGDLADRLFRVEYWMAERHLAWLCEQCEADWILRLDGDEVPSAAFLRRLPEMLACREVGQFWSAQAWLYPDAEHLLADRPWSSDFHVRLIRNDGTSRFPGMQHLHVEPGEPREYVAEPVYHLDLLLSDEARRREKAIRYELARPGLRAAGGGPINESFYLPELRPSLQVEDVPAEDRDAIARALAAKDPGCTGAGPVGRARASKAEAAPDDRADRIDARPRGIPFVSLREMDRAWEGRDVGEGAYAASIEPLESPCAFASEEQRVVFFAVTNEGDERWPAGLEEMPLIRMAYRWLKPDGSVHVAEGLRSPFPRRVRPGERLLVPLHVRAPAAAGDFVLEVDLVHEHVRWFERSCRVPAVVQPDGCAIRHITCI